MGEFLVESMSRYLGQTVTIFTTSGGLSGAGVVMGQNFIA